MTALNPQPPPPDDMVLRTIIQTDKEGHVADILSQVDNPFEVIDKCARSKYSKLSSIKNEQFSEQSPALVAST